MNEAFSLGKMSADAKLTATFKYYEKTEQDGEIIITACLGDGDVHGSIVAMAWTETNSGFP